MKKFMVKVNNKYIVMVESTSNGGAEHIVLDNIKNATSSLAFDIEAKETQWEMFQHALSTMEVISFDELKQKDRQAQIKKMEIMNELAEEQQHYEMEIKRLEEKLSQTKVELEITKKNIMESEIKSGMQCRFYSKEEMQ